MTDFKLFGIQNIILYSIQWYLNKLLYLLTFIYIKNIYKKKYKKRKEKKWIKKEVFMYLQFTYINPFIEYVVLLINLSFLYIKDIHKVSVFVHKE